MMGTSSDKVATSADNGRLASLTTWIDDRFPMTALWKSQVSEYYAPKNFNFWYYFGSLAAGGAGHPARVRHLPDHELQAVGDAEAFDSVEYIMRDVEWGWLIRYMHSTGASAFFIVVYLHMFRALLYGSYQKPRELLWIFGMLIYFALMAEAFMGYLLPWGNMSYWGAQVIVSLFGTIPAVGDSLTEWIRGDFDISDVTLNRFFALHVVAVPLVLVLLVIAAPGGAAPGRLEQPGRRRDQESEGPGRHAARRHPVPPVLHGQGHGRRRRVPDPVQHGGVLRADDGRLLPRDAELRAGQPAADAAAHRAGVVLHAVLRDPARGPQTRASARC